LALESLARSLIQKIMHQPTVEMRNAAGVDNQDLLNAAKVLFGLNDEFDNNKRIEKIVSSQSNDND
jgi:glutamyl-tRNA reductase